MVPLCKHVLPGMLLPSNALVPSLLGAQTSLSTPLNC